MSEEMQITYMQTRLIRLASEEWNLSVEKILALFEKYGVLPFIRECFDAFHVTGDAAVLEDVREYLISKGVVFSE